jgi:hypothetical protein
MQLKHVSRGMQSPRTTSGNSLPCNEDSSVRLCEALDHLSRRRRICMKTAMANSDQKRIFCAPSTFIIADAARDRKNFNKAWLNNILVNPGWTIT